MTTKNPWEQEAVSFDLQYSERSPLAKVPFIGGFVQRSLNERMARALAFVGDCKGKRIIDLGCGVGRFALEAARRGATVYGYDISASAIELARRAAAQSKVEESCIFTQADLRETAFPDADLWVDMGTLQYIPDIRPILERLRPVGRGMSTLPMRGHWLNPARVMYRSVLKGSRFYVYSEAEIRDLFRDRPDLAIERVGSVYYVRVRSVQNAAHVS